MEDGAQRRRNKRNNVRGVPREVTKSYFADFPPAICGAACGEGRVRSWPFAEMHYSRRSWEASKASAKFPRDPRQLGMGNIAIRRAYLRVEQ